MINSLPFLESVSVMVGTIIGAGIIGLPYVFAQSGFITASLVLIFVGVALLMVRLMIGETIMRTGGIHQLTGYSGIYLGSFVRNIQAFILVISLYGVLLAYMVAQGEVLSTLFGGSSILWSLIFYLFFSFLLIYGINIVKRSELTMMVAVFFIMAVIGFLSTSSIDLGYLSGFDVSKSLLPLGVILFSISGLVSVPEAWRVVKDAGKDNIFKSVLIWGGLIPIIIYFIFSLLVVGITGPETSQVATISLGGVIGPHMVIIGNVFAFFTVATSFLTLALSQKDIFEYDYSLPRHLVSGLVLIVPFVLFVLGLRDFISIISFVGALMVGVNGILAVLVFWKARSNGKLKPKYSIPVKFAAPASVLAIIIFLAGFLTVFI